MPPEADDWFVPGGASAATAAAPPTAPDHGADDWITPGTAAPPSAAAQPLGTQEKPYRATNQAAVDWFNAHAPPGSWVDWGKGPMRKRVAEAATPVDQSTGKELDTSDLEGNVEPPPAGPSVFDVAGRAAERGALPAIGGMAGFGTGAELGAAIGAPLGPVGAGAGALIGGLGGAYLGGEAASRAQEAILDRLPESLKMALGQSAVQREADIKAHPYVAAAGELAPNIALMGPFGAAPELEAGAGAVQRLLANPVTSRAVGAGLMGAQEAVNQAAQGQPIDLGNVAIAAGAGAFMNRPTALGERIMGAGSAPIRALAGRATSEATAAAPTPAPAQPPPAVGTVVHMQMGAQGVQPMTVSGIGGGMIRLQDEAGTNYSLPLTNFERLRQPSPPPETPPAPGIAGLLPPPPRLLPAPEAAYGEGFTMRPPEAGAAPIVPEEPPVETTDTAQREALVEAAGRAVEDVAPDIEDLGARAGEVAAPETAPEETAPIAAQIARDHDELAQRTAAPTEPSERPDLPTEQVAPSPAPLTPEAQAPPPAGAVPQAPGTVLGRVDDLSALGLKPKGRGTAGEAAQVAWYQARRDNTPVTLVMTAYGPRLLRGNEAIPYGNPHTVVTPDGKSYSFRPQSIEELPEEIAPAAQLSFRSLRGQPEQAFVPSSGEALPIEYGIADIHDLVSSNHDDLSPNAEYPQALQPRHRERAATEAQINSILSGGEAGAFRPELLGETPDAATGAPVVGTDRLVESGNGRVMALRRAYDRGLPQAEEYRNYLAAQGYPVEGIANPVLVRLNRSGMDMPQREQLARDLNVPAVAAMSAGEQAMADAKQIPAENLRGYAGGDIFSAANIPYLKGLLGSFVRPNELPAMTNPEGGLSAVGRRRVLGALLAKAYGDSGIVAALTEDADSNIKAIGNALSDASPAWAMMREAVAAGRVPQEYDLTSPLLEAVRLISHARDEGRNIAEFVNQRGLFGEGVSPETEGVLSWMLGAPDWTRRYGREKMADALTEYANAAQRVGGLFAEARAVPSQLIEEARVRAQGATRDLFAPPVGQQRGAEAVRPVAGEVRPEVQRPETPATGVAAPEGGPAGRGRRGRPPTLEEIPAYHGSPHRFEQFLLDKIGTGEGAQAYGHGLYFAENPRVAESYQPPPNEGVSVKPGFQYDPTELGILNRAVQQHPGEDIPALLTKQEQLYRERGGADALADAIKRARENLEAGNYIPTPPGHLYEVRIDADPEEMLDWDRPLSEQSPQVRGAIDKLPSATSEASKVAARYFEQAGREMTGGDLHRTLAHELGVRNPERPGFPDNAGAAQLIKEAGIPGIRYLDQGSRGAGDGTYNYVVFDPDKIRIVSRDGVALGEEPAAGGIRAFTRVEEPPSPEPGSYRDLADDWRAYRSATDFPAGTAGSHMAARAYVRDRGGKTGNEHFAAYDPALDGITHVGTNDRPNAVSIPDSITQRADGNFVIHHNHPMSRAPSGGDVAALGYPGIGQVLAHTHDQDVFSVQLSPEGRAWRDANADPESSAAAIRAVYVAADRIVNQALKAQTLGHVITPADHDALQADLTNRALDAAGLTNYLSTRTAAPLSDQVRDSILRRAAESAAGNARRFGMQLRSGRGLDAVLHDRPTVVSGADQIMAGLSGRNVGVAAEPAGGPRGGAASEAGAERPPLGPEPVVDRGEAPSLAEQPPGGGEPPRGPSEPPGEFPDPERRNADLSTISHTDNRGTLDKIRDFIDYVRRGGALLFRQRNLDNLEALERLERGVGAVPGTISPTMSARFAKNWQGTLETVLRKYQVRYDPEIGTVEPIDGSKSLETIWQPLQQAGSQALNDFALWSIAKRASRLMAEGRERNVPQEMIDQYQDLNRLYQLPDGGNLFDQVHGDLQEYHNNLLNLLEDAGIINADSRKLWQHDDYVPFYRALDPDGIAAPGPGGRGIAGVRSPIRELKGGEQKINNIYENIVLNTSAAVRRSMANIAMRKARDLAVFNTDALTPMSKEARAVYADPAIQQSLRDVGLDPAALDAAAKRGAIDLFGALRRRDPDVVSVMDNGKVNYYRVNDPFLLESLTAAGPSTMSGLGRLLTSPARLLRAAVVFDPAFAFAHNIRMMGHAYLLMGVRPWQSIAETIREAKGLDETALRLQAAGALSGKYDVEWARHMRLGLEQQGFRLIDTPMKAYELLRDLGEGAIRAADIGPRVAVYKQALAEGMDEASAMNRARDLLDFSTHGNGAAAMFLARTIPFLNARWQGLDRSYRGFRGTDRNGMLMRGALVMGATLALWEMNKDDPEYQRMPDYQRQYAWWINMKHFGGSGWVGIPKPFELGAIFASLPEMIAQYNHNGSARELWGAANQMITSTFRFNPVPAAIRPIGEVLLNHDMYTGRPIINEREQELEPELQYGPATSESVIALTNTYNSSVPHAAQIAPDNVQHLLRGYLAGWGGYLTAGADYLGNEMGLLPARAAPAEMPVIGRFYQQQPEPSNRLLGDFYDMRKAITEVGNSIKAAQGMHDQALASELRAGHPEYSPAMQSQLNRIGLQLSKMRGVYQKSVMDPNIPAEQKTAAQTRYFEQRDRLLDQVKPTLRRAEGISVSP